MWFADFALRRPYTIVASLILVCLMGLGAGLRMPIDIFPEIDIPVVSVVWTYQGMSAPDIRDRILTLHQRQLASLVDDISRIEATAYAGVGVEKVYLHEGANVTRAISQLASSALVVLKYMPPNITPPLVLRYGATDVPIIQLSLSSDSLPDSKLNDLGQNIIRPDLAVVHGAEVPYPYGGKPRVIMVDLDQQALASRGLTPSDVATAIQQQNVILPSGDVKMGTKDYSLAMNNSPNAIEAINHFPVREVAGQVVFVRDVAHVHDGFQTQTNSVSVDGQPGALMTVRKTGGVSTLAVIDGVREALPDVRRLMPAGVNIKAIFDQSVFVKASLNSVLMGGMIAAGLTAMMILLFLGNWRLTLIILATIPISIIAAILIMFVDGQTLNTMTLGGFALAVGILVDNSTVVIENIERHVKEGEALRQAIVTGCGEVAVPTALSTLCICIVFVPVFLLEGTAKYLFSPLSLSVCVSLIASLALSFTLVPVLFSYLMRSSLEGHEGASPHDAAPRSRFNVFSLIHHKFEDGFNSLRDGYRNVVAFCVGRAGHHQRFLRAVDRFLPAAVPAPRQGFFPPGGRRPDAPPRSRAARQPAGGDPALFRRSRECDTPDRRPGSDRGHPRQHRSAV
jgi:multidrug efflux pump subunit AcrB